MGTEKTILELVGALIFMALSVTGAMIFVIKKILPAKLKAMQTAIGTEAEATPYISSAVIAKMIKEAVKVLTENDLTHLQGQIEKILQGCSVCGEKLGRLDERMKSAEEDIKELFSRK